MGRDDSQGKSNNTRSLPQTPKNLKISPNKVNEEFSQELDELGELVRKAKNNTKNNK
ncbi:YfhD family protein [Ureibacillus acetophenoni]|uniref:YfhD-like protein n=1 Tax=Ureibacillus acetophenoni TaxID=614649 RepID=A0A285UD08_9BACL|nr:YfhD family protein [Ureibacillus acetophenoni]SOC39288.1 hypothetical protein SAMN05877842_105144 [Ureibacillus acetophenoni]